MNRCTLVNGLRLQLGAVVASSWFIDELRIAHGPQLIPMSARSGTYKQLQRTVIGIAGWRSARPLKPGARLIGLLGRHHWERRNGLTRFLERR